MSSSVWVASGAISGMISVAMGAFGAHALAEKLTPRLLAIWQTAAQYQMYHALALVLFGLFQAQNPASSGDGITQAVGWAFLGGTLLFSGSLYALALTDIKVLGAITPLGGLGFLAGWALFARAALVAARA